MDKGDFFVHFMDLTEEELKKPVDDIVPPRLEALLELALRMSTANTDPFKDDLKVGTDMEPLQFYILFLTSGVFTQSEHFTAVDFDEIILIMKKIRIFSFMAV